MSIKQKKFKIYDAWLLWSLSYRCNLDCAYCFIASSIRKTAKVPNIDISSLTRVIENTHKTFKFFFSGGEPFLTPNLVEACIEITKKHYISLATNLTDTRVKEFAERVNPKRVFRIRASAHTKELERLNLLDTYINNFLLLKEKGFNVKAVEVAYPPLLNEVKKYKQLFKKKGIELNFIPFFGDYSGKKYPGSYTEQELRIFGVDILDVKKLYQRGKICNGGYNAGVVFPNGDIQPCPEIKEDMGNIYEKIEFKNKLIICPFEFCGCPLKSADPYLFEKALEEAAVLHALSRKFDRFLGKIGLFLKRNYPRLYFLIKKIKD